MLLRNFAERYSLVDKQLYVEPGFCIFAAVLLMVLPVSWILAAFAAGLWHELFHIAAIICVNGHVEKIRINVGGAEIETQLSGGFSEIIVALAGPAGSFLLLILYKHFTKLAVCGLVHGLYNMLPIYPMDGGRALSCFLALLFPDSADRIMKIIQCTVTAMLFLTAIYGIIICKVGIWPIFVVYITTVPWIRRKIPCKRGQIRVQ